MNTAWRTTSLKRLEPAAALHDIFLSGKMHQWLIRPSQSGSAQLGATFRGFDHPRVPLKRPSIVRQWLF